MLGLLDNHKQKNQVGLIKINSKGIKDLTIKEKTIKISGENTWVNLCDFGYSNGILNRH